MQKKLLFIIDPHPEAIKMAPLIQKSKEYKNCKTIVCITAQHRGMLDQVLTFFNITPNYDLNLMKPNQDLFDITTSGLMRLRTVLEEVNPDLVFIQEDTTTAFIGALATFYHKM
ncbi:MULTISPECIES: UDP-N-acetylglucosamine 2-epimerase [unclassified Candidatus Tisiphia]|uniref:UDP-N-acetylglucosamine 2-epimerase n=2 Tax=Candidatus Tisiphia TaxID=2996317 RepID=UPI00312C924D